MAVTIEIPHENEWKNQRKRSEVQAMKITKEQLETAERGTPVEIEEDNKEYVLISRERYEQLANLCYEDLDAETTYGTVLDAWDSVGSPNDATDYL